MGAVSDQQYDRWFAIDLPVLRAVVALSDERVGVIYPDAICVRTGLDKSAVAQSLLALAHEDPPLFDAPGAHSGWNRQVTAVHSVTGHARRMAGAWPTKEALSVALAEQMIKGLNDAADAEDDDEQRGKMKRTASWIGGAGKDVFANVVAAVIAKQMGMQ